MLTEKPPLPVGWARVPLFQRQPVHGATSVTSLEIKWDLQEGDHTYDLHPGDIPDSLISTQPITPSEQGATEEGMYCIHPPLGLFKYFFFLNVSQAPKAVAKDVQKPPF